MPLLWYPYLKVYDVGQRRIFTLPYLLINNAASLFESALLLLFTVCSYCRSRYTRVSKAIIGSFLRITQTCSRCGYRFIWESQPYIGGTPAGNILMSAAILYSGLIPAKALRLFRTLKCSSISRKTFFRHQSHYLQPPVNRVWSQQQNSLLQDMKTQKKKLVLGGDGRADSPGHSAKYGTYSLVELSYINTYKYWLQVPFSLNL